MSAPARRITFVGRPCQSTLRTEIENDSGAVRPDGRIDAGISEASPIKIVVGPVCPRCRMTGGRRPNTFWKSEAKSSAASWIGPASLAASRIETDPLRITEFGLADRATTRAATRLPDRCGRAKTYSADEQTRAKTADRTTTLCEILEY